MYACKQKTCKDTGRKWPSVDQEDASEETKFVKTFISNFQPLELWRNKFLSLGSPLACKEIKPVNPKGSQPWILMGRTDAELKHLLRPPAVKSWFIGTDHDAGKDRGQQEEEGSGKLDSSTDSVDMSLSELQETLRGGQAWCAAVHGFAESDRTERLNSSNIFVM